MNLQEQEYLSPGFDFSGLLTDFKLTKVNVPGQELKTRGRPKKLVKHEGVFVHKQVSARVYGIISNIDKYKMMVEWTTLRDASSKYIDIFTKLSEKYKIPYFQVYEILEKV